MDLAHSHPIYIRYDIILSLYLVTRYTIAVSDYKLTTSMIEQYIKRHEQEIRRNGSNPRAVTKCVIINMQG